MTEWSADVTEPSGGAAVRRAPNPERATRVQSRLRPVARTA